MEVKVELFPGSGFTTVGHKQHFRSVVWTCLPRAQQVSECGFIPDRNYSQNCANEAQASFFLISFFLFCCFKEILSP